MMNGKGCTVHKLAYALVLIGALNWGLVGLAGLNLVASLLGSAPTLERLVYVLVGLSALAMLAKGKCKQCGNGDKGCCANDDKGCCSDGRTHA